MFTACDCDPVGSEHLACDENGNCVCKENVDGRRCDRCMENKQNIAQGCVGMSNTLMDLFY